MSNFFKIPFAAFLLSLIGFLTGVIFESVLVGFAAVVVVSLSWNHPRWVFLGLLALVPFSRSPQSQFFSPESVAQTKTLFLFLLVGVCWIRSQNRLLEQERPAGFYWLLAAWGVLTMLSWFQSVNPWNSFSYIFLSSSGLLFFLLVTAADEDLLRKATWVILIVALGVCLLSLLQYLIMKYGILTSLQRFVLAPRERAYLQAYGAFGEKMYRVSGTFTHPNQLGAYLAVLLPFACAVLCQINLSKGKRLFLFLLVPLLVATLYATNSRNAVVFVTMSALYLSFRKPFHWLLCVGVLLISLLGVFYLSNPEGAQESFIKIARVQTGLSSREKIWKDSAELAWKNLPLGVGPGNFSESYVSDHGYFVFQRGEDMAEQAAIFLDIGELYTKSFHAHNVYLQLLAELGPVALILFVASCFYLLLLCESRIRRYAAVSPQRPLLLCVAALVFGFLFYGIFESHLFFQTLSLNQLVGVVFGMGLKS